MKPPVLQRKDIELRNLGDISVRRTILAIETFALPPDLADRTVVARGVAAFAAERVLQRCGASSMAHRIQGLRHAWSFFWQCKNYDAIVTNGDLTGLTIAFLSRVFRRRKVHVMCDCLWYGGNLFKRAWMHFCILGVDTCVVWSSIECQRYAKAYRVPESRFLFVPHHHTTMHYQFEVEDGGYLFTGGNWSRDYELFLEAVHDVDFPCILATNRPELLSGLEIPKHVRVISATHSEFRELLARSAFLVLPMQANLLHAGGQQTMLNAMMMRKPVVLTDVEGGADYIDHGRTGFLVPYRDAKALREIINFLVANPAERERVGRNASEAALSLTTERCNTTIWVEVLRLVEQSRQEKGLTTEGTLIV